jgi:hypothetical protein
VQVKNFSERRQFATRYKKVSGDKGLAFVLNKTKRREAQARRRC